MKYALMINALFSAAAHAGTIYSADAQRAIVLSVRNEAVVAQVCDKVSGDEMRAPSEATLTSKCQPIPGSLDLATIERTLPRLKAKQVQDIERQKEVFFADLKSDREAIERIVGPRFQQMIDEVNRVTPSGHFAALKAAAAESTVIEQDAEGLQDSIDALTELANP